MQHRDDIDHYIATELAQQALLGPFDGPPVAPTHMSPLMTGPKKDSPHWRVIMDLSWPGGPRSNDGVDADTYLGSKTDLARGYRQLRVDPTDWLLLGLQHKGTFYLDL